MGYLQSARQRIGSAARTVGKHAATAGKAALTAAVVAGAAYNAYQTHGEVQARRGIHSSGVGFTNPLHNIPGFGFLELMREQQEERRLGVRR